MTNAGVSAMREYDTLPVHRLTGTVYVSRPAPPKSVTLESPALDVMTDLRHTLAAVIEPHVTMDAANAYMMQRGVRSLLVLNHDRALGGVITADDVLGEKPLRLSEERRIKHHDILVADIMTPLDRLEAIPLEDARHAKVGHVIRTLRDTGRQHTLVIEKLAHGKVQVCGIFSLSQIEKQLGAPIESTGVATSFAEIEATLQAS